MSKAGTLSSKETLALARQGDPRVIGILLNHVFQTKGIKAQIVRRDRCLHVLLESAQTLNPQAATAFIHNSIKTLQVETISTIRVYGRQIGQKSIAWNQEIQLSWDYISPGSSPDSESSQESYSEFSKSEGVTQAPISSVESNPDRSGSTIHPSLVYSDSMILSTQSSSSSEPAESSINSPTASSETRVESSSLSSPVSEAPSQLSTPEEARNADWLKRPEAVVLIIFVSMIMLWQMYLDLIEDPDLSKPLTGRELARRLGVNSSTISRKKERENFSEWAQDLDPDGVAWVYQDGWFVSRFN